MDREDRIVRWCREQGFAEVPVEGADATQFVDGRRRIEVVDGAVRLTNGESHVFTGVEDVELADDGMQLHDAVQIPLSAESATAGTPLASRKRAQSGLDAAKSLLGW